MATTIPHNLFVIPTQDQPVFRMTPELKTASCQLTQTKLGVLLYSYKYDALTGPTARVTDSFQISGNCINTVAGVWKKNIGPHSLQTMPEKSKLVNDFS